MRPYYYVYKVGGNLPKHKHATMKLAQAVAEHLAINHPGESFEILKCVGISSVPAQKTSTFWMDGEFSPDGEVGLPFPDDFPELPPLPKGCSRWVYRGKFSNDVTAEVEYALGRIVKFWDDGEWIPTENFSLDYHHIEAI